MSKIVFKPNDSGAGTFTFISPATNTNQTLNLPDESGTLGTVDGFTNILQEVLENSTGNSTTTRQTVLTGPVDSEGRADFLQSGFGSVSTFGISSSEPLEITFGDGFNAGEQRNIGVSIENNLTWSELPDNEEKVFLFIQIDNGTVSTFHETSAPEYAQARPSNPSTGDTFYPIDHRHRMERYDGTSWDNSVLRICVGECATSGGSVVDLRSYAYQGKYRWIEQDGDVNHSSSNNYGPFKHYLGVDGSQIKTSGEFRYKNATSGYDVGDSLATPFLLFDNDNSDAILVAFENLKETTEFLIIINNTPNLVSKTGGGNSNSTNDTTLTIDFERKF